MSIDHFGIEPVDDIVEFNNADYATEYEAPFYLDGDTVYCGVYIKAISGTVYIRVTVTDSGSNTVSKTSNGITSTSWQKLTGSNRLVIDCSGLTKGAALFKVETKGYGQRKNLYRYQE